MKRKTRKLLLPALVAAPVFLIGCGSGGDSSSEPVQKPASITFNQSYFATDDGENVKLKGTFPEPDSIMIEQVPDIGLELVNAKSGVVELAVPNLDRPMTTKLSITITASDREVTNEISILARNISGEHLVAKAETAIRERSALLSLEQDAALYTFFVDYSYLAGVIGYSEKEDLLSNFNPAPEATYSNLSTVLMSLTSDIALYNQGDIGEDDLGSGLALVDAAVAEHGSYGATLLGNFHSYVQVLVPSLAGGIIKYDADLGVFSRFTVGDQYGAKVNGQFVIDDSYAPIESLIRVSPSQPLTCEVL